VSVKIVYHPASADVTLTFKRGPLNFRPYFDGRVHDNLASSGAARERVTEHLDILISFDTPHLVVADDLTAWGSFMAFALPGGQFKLYPCDALPDYYNCVLEDNQWGPTVNGPGKYGATVVVRVLADGQAPSGPDVVLRRFYGMAS
jgi:hypothetical protein